jgi:hypothetical protein
MGRGDDAMNEQDAGTQQQEEQQGLAQQYDDDEMLRRILRVLAKNESLGPLAFKYLCSALKIDVRDVT